MNRALIFGNGLLLAVLVGGSLYVYPELPERIPLHFGADGTADRWGDRTLLSWMMLPLIAAATVSLTSGIALLMPHRPSIINMPDKQKLLQLPPHLQRWVLDGAAATLHVTSLLLTIMFGLIQYGAYRTAMSGDGAAVMQTALILGLVGLPLVAIVTVIVMQKRTDAAWREHRSSDAAAASDGA